MGTWRLGVRLVDHKRQVRSHIGDRSEDSKEMECKEVNNLQRFLLVDCSTKTSSSVGLVGLDLSSSLPWVVPPGLDLSTRGIREKVPSPLNLGDISKETTHLSCETSKAQVHFTLVLPILLTPIICLSWTMSLMSV